MLGTLRCYQFPGGRQQDKKRADRDNGTQNVHIKQKAMQDNHSYYCVTGRNSCTHTRICGSQGMPGCIERMDCL